MVQLIMHMLLLLLVAVGGGGRSGADIGRAGQVLLHGSPDAPGLLRGVPELVPEGAGLDEVAQLGVVIASAEEEKIA